MEKYVFFLSGNRYLQLIGVKICMSLSWVFSVPVVGFSTFGGGIFRSLQMGVKNVFFGQFVFGVSSSVCVINRIH